MDKYGDLFSPSFSLDNFFSYFRIKHTENSRKHFSPKTMSLMLFGCVCLCLCADWMTFWCVLCAMPRRSTSHLYGLWPSYIKCPTSNTHHTHTFCSAVFLFGLNFRNSWDTYESALQCKYETAFAYTNKFNSISNGITKSSISFRFLFSVTF